MQFTPADIVVQIDLQWLANTDIQVSGRPNRNRPIQPAEFTESFRLVGVCDWFPIGTLLTDRHRAQRAVFDKLNTFFGGKKAGKQVEEIDSADE